MSGLFERSYIWIRPSRSSPFVAADKNPVVDRSNGSRSRPAWHKPLPTEIGDDEISNGGSNHEASQSRPFAVRNSLSAPGAEHHAIAPDCSPRHIRQRGGDKGSACMRAVGYR